MNWGVLAVATYAVVGVLFAGFAEAVYRRKGESIGANMLAILAALWLPIMLIAFPLAHAEEREAADLSEQVRAIRARAALKKWGQRARASRLKRQEGSHE